MAIFLLACKEMTTKVKKLLIWMFLLHLEFHRLVLPVVPYFNGNLIVSNNTLAFFCRLIRFYFTSLYRGMRIKATIVVYVFLVQCFENATIVAYVGLRVWHPAFKPDLGSITLVFIFNCN